jgi:hypothetical protein
MAGVPFEDDDQMIKINPKKLNGSINKYHRLPRAIVLGITQISRA